MICPPSQSKSLGGILLGAFVVVQFAFIVFANVGSMFFYLSKSSAVAATIWDVTGSFIEPWGQLTGQEQYWRMFAPSVPPRAMFVRLRLRSGEVIGSEFESVDGPPKFHWPGSGERLWHVEKSLALPLAIYDREWIADDPAGWRAYLHGAVDRQRHRYRAYLDWKMRRHLESKPEAKAIESVELLVSIHTLSRHDAASRPEFEVPLVRAEGDAELQLGFETPHP